MAPSPTPGILYHPQLGPCAYQLTSVSSDPDTQVQQVVGMMNQYSRADSRSPAIAADAAAATDTRDPVEDTWRYLSRRDHGSRGMEFLRDEILGQPVEAALPRWEPVVEALIRPCDQALLPQPIGDCDDFAMYGAAHLLYRGVSCSFVTVAADAEQPDIYSHVYLVAYPQQGRYAGLRVAMDLSHGWYLGWEHPNPFRIREWPIVAGLSGGFMLGALAAGGILLYAAARGRSN